METKSLRVKLSVIASLILLSGMFAPFQVYAASINLVGEIKGATGVADLVNKIYLFSLGIGAAAAFLVIIYGAVLWTASEVVSKKEEAKEWIKGAVWGLLLLLMAYLILYIINPSLTILKDPERILKQAPASTAVSSQVPGYTTGETQDTGTLGLNSRLTEATVRQELSASNINTKTECPPGQSEDCVSFDGMRLGTLNEIKYIAAAAGATNVFITGGTENAHATGIYSHANGYKFDINLDNELNSYITSNFLRIGTRSDGAVMYQNPSTGAIYAREGNHWDVALRIPTEDSSQLLR